MLRWTRSARCSPTVSETGANEIYSVSYYSSGYDDAYAEALKKAVDLARTKAEALAEASGRTLGYVVSIEEYSDRPVTADMWTAA